MKFSKNSNLYDTIPQRYRRTVTDGRTTCHRNSALRVAYLGKKMRHGQRDFDIKLELIVS